MFNIFLKKSLKKIAFILFLSVYGFHAFAQEKYVFVLDTSRSVTSRQIYSSFKEIIGEIINSTKENDQITFFTFDSDVIKKAEKENKSNVIPLFENINPTGLWTYTSLMLKEVVDYLNENYQPTQVFLLSDGIDDPPPNLAGEKQNTSFANYENSESNIFYIYYRENQTQKSLINKAFPNVISRQIRTGIESNQEIAISILDYFKPRTEIDINGLESPLATGKLQRFDLIVTANRAVIGKEALLRVKANVDLWKNFSFSRENNNKEETQRFTLEKENNFNDISYIISDSFQGKESSISFQLSLVEDPTNNLVENNITISLIELPFLEKLYKLPLYSIPFLFFLVLVLYILYKFIRYQIFVPSIEMSYHHEGNKKGTENIGEPIKSSINVGGLANKKYTISSKPDAFLVLPELSSYAELILVKKGKKFKTRLLIHPSSLREISTLQGARIKKRRIKNKTTFRLENYVFSFRTNLEK